MPLRDPDDHGATSSGAGATIGTPGAIVLQTTGEEEFAEVDVAVGGTGAWAGATGTITATGTFDPVAGGTGRYAGEICTP
jgi:hypothetical protein